MEQQMGDEAAAATAMILLDAQPSFSAYDFKNLPFSPSSNLFIPIGVMNATSSMGIAIVRPCFRLLLRGSGKAAGALSEYPFLFSKCPRIRPMASSAGVRRRSVVPARAVAGARSMGTSAESAVGREKAFDRIDKPIVIDREEPEIHQQPGPPPAAEKEELAPPRKETEEEKEAWRLLRKSVVNYCGSPVGTVAADDLMTSGQMLNYD